MGSSCGLSVCVLKTRTTGLLHKYTACCLHMENAAIIPLAPEVHKTWIIHMYLSLFQGWQHSLAAHKTVNLTNWNQVLSVNLELNIFWGRNIFRYENVRVFTFFLCVLTGKFRNRGLKAYKIWEIIYLYLKFYRFQVIKHGNKFWNFHPCHCFKSTVIYRLYTSGVKSLFQSILFPVVLVS